MLDTNVKLIFSVKNCPGHGSGHHGSPQALKSGETSGAFCDDWITDLLKDCQAFLEEDQSLWACKRCKFGNRTDQEHT